MITVHQPINTAPACVWFEADDWADWDFGDGLAAEGHLAAHVYTEPGVYFVRANNEQTTVTVTEWQGATWAVSTNANVAADRHFSTLQAALNAYSGGAVQILLRRGETYTITAFEDLKAGLRLGAFGTGARPVVQSSVDMFKRCRGVIQVEGIEFAGPWDAATGTGAAPTAFVATDTGDMVFTDCTFRGLGIAVNLQVTGGSFAFDDSSVTGWQNYGVLAGKSFLFALTNSNIQQAADALPGPENKHGPVRITRPEGPHVIADCALRSLNGWSTAGPAQAHQACLRWNVLGVPGARLACTATQMVGGWSIIDAFGNTSTAADAPGDARFVGCELIGTANTYCAARLGHTGTVFEGCDISFAPGPWETNKSVTAAFDWDMDNPTGDNVWAFEFSFNAIYGVDVLTPGLPPRGTVATSGNTFGEEPMPDEPEPMEPLDLALLITLTPETPEDANLLALLRQALDASDKGSAL